MLSFSLVYTHCKLLFCIRFMNYSIAYTLENNEKKTKLFFETAVHTFIYRGISYFNNLLQLPVTSAGR